jgi:hypothetical protein
MIGRLVCLVWAHKRGQRIAAGAFGRRHVEVYQCDRCNRALSLEWWDPR